MPKIDDLLKIVKEASASDLHLGAGSVPMIRQDGVPAKPQTESVEV